MKWIQNVNNNVIKKEQGKNALPSDNNSPISTVYPKETEQDEKIKSIKQKRKVLSSDNNRTGEKKQFCLQITTAQLGLTTQERQNREKKSSLFR